MAPKNETGFECIESAVLTLPAWGKKLIGGLQTRRICLPIHQETILPLLDHQKVKAEAFLKTKMKCLQPDWPDNTVWGWNTKHTVQSVIGRKSLKEELGDDNWRSCLDVESIGHSEVWIIIQIIAVKTPNITDHMSSSHTFQQEHHYMHGNMKKKVKNMFHMKNAQMTLKKFLINV